jgi:hypothetical protein
VHICSAVHNHVNFSFCIHVNDMSNCYFRNNANMALVCISELVEILASVEF